MAGPKGLKTRPADDQNDAYQHQQPQLAHPPAGPNAYGVDGGPGRIDAGFGAVDQTRVTHAGRARSRRIRIRPICSSSPYPSGRYVATRLPFTHVPLVLPRSSTYQARPRNVSSAWSAETYVSSITIELFTSRPIELTASSG